MGAIKVYGNGTRTNVASLQDPNVCVTRHHPTLSFSRHAELATTMIHLLWSKRACARMATQPNLVVVFTAILLFGVIHER